MSYRISAFIARTGTFDPIQTLNRCIIVAPLNQGFELLYSDDVLERTIQESHLSLKDNFIQPFEYSRLSRALFSWGAEFSYRQPIAYIEAEFFGGVGFQNSLVWSEGKVVLLPVTNSIESNEYASRGLNWTNAPINSALRFLGVKVGTFHDEFEAIGLQQCRSHKGWFDKFNVSPDCT